MAQAELARSLTLPQLILIGVGTVVGAGIYSVVGAAVALSGRATWLGMLLAGVVASLTALSYAELVSARHRAGAEYQFMRAAFPGHPRLAYLAGFLVVFNCVATAAAVALAFAGYLGRFVVAPETPSAVVLLAGCTLLNILGIRQAAWVGIALIFAEIGGLLLVIFLGLARGDPASALSWAAPVGPAGLFAGAALLFFAYIGFEEVANLAEEAREPMRDMPRALLASVVVTSVLYVALVWALLSALQPQELAASSAPLADAAERIAPWSGPVVAVAALFATASTALLSLASVSRLLFAMGRDGALPAVLAKTARARQTPWPAALLLLAATCAFLPLGKVEIVASVAALGVLIAFSGVHACLIALRLRPEAPTGGFRIPFSIRGIPATAVIGLFANLLLMTQFAPKVYVVVALTLAVGLGAYPFLRQRRH